MGYHKSGTAFHQGAQALLDHGFALRVETRCGFIENKNARVCQDRPGDSHTLALAAGKFDAALSDDGVEAVVQFQREFIDSGDLGGNKNVVVGC